jgi:transcriptional regulator with XRE-family HTH domain
MLLFGQRIRDLRIAREWTMEDLAARARVSLSTVRHVELAQSKAHRVIKDAIEKALAAPPEPEGS